MIPQFPPKPRFRDAFVTDLRGNLLRYSNGGTTRLSHHHLMSECVWYSCDMCLEFQRQSDGLLTSDWIEHIVTEVSAAIAMIHPREFGDADKHAAIQKVKELMKRPAPNLQKEVDKYYNRI